MVLMTFHSLILSILTTTLKSEYYPDFTDKEIWPFKEMKYFI